MTSGNHNTTPPASPRRPAEELVPRGMRIAGAWAWRLLAIAGVIALFMFLVVQLRLIVIPLMVAILLGALLVPLVRFLQSRGWPKWVAVTFAEVGLLAIVTGLVYLIVTQIMSGFPDLQERTTKAFEQFKAFLLASPLHLTETEINAYVAQAVEAIQRDSAWLLSGALSLGSSFGHFLAGILLVLFSTLFILIDGSRIWEWTVRLFPRNARRAIDGSGRAGWVTLSDFVKVQILVAAIDAIGIGLGAVILGLPLAVPIGIAVFLGSFIPVIGAVLTGIVAVFVALVYNGPVIALIMLGIVLLVQQVEGHVLQPLIMGSAVRMHALAVVFAVAAGGYIAGIAGALFAVPIVATLNAMVGYIARGDWRTEPPIERKDVLPDA